MSTSTNQSTDSTIVGFWVGNRFIPLHRVTSIEKSFCDRWYVNYLDDQGEELSCCCDAPGSIFTTLLTD